MTKTQTLTTQTVTPPPSEAPAAKLPENQGKVAKGTNPVAEIAYGLDAMTPQIKQVLPAHITPDRFKRVVMTAVYRDSNLLSANRQSLFNECLKCASDGLVPDGREAALVIFGGKVQYMPMVFGILKRLRQSAEIASISARVVYQKEVDEARFRFVIDEGEEKLSHEPILIGERGEPVLVYATCRFKDGTVQNEPLTKADIEKIKRASKTSGSGPWVQWQEEMWRKSAIRRLSKYLPLSAEDRRVVERDEEPTDFEEQKQEAIEAAKQSPAAAAMLAGPVDEVIDADTGEVTEEQPDLIGGK